LDAMCKIKKKKLEFIMNAFATRWLFSTNHKDIGTLYMIFGFFSGMIGTIVSIMLLAGLNVGLFYILSVLHLGICSSIFFIMLGFSVDLREAVFFTGLEVLCLLCFKTQDLLEHAHSIVQFVKQSIECLDTELLIVYYQISCLVLLLDSFSTWFWFTTITIVLLPLISIRRHPNNVMLTHNLFCCVEPLLFLLRGVAFLRLSLCISVGLLLPLSFIPAVFAESDDEAESSNKAESVDYQTPIKKRRVDTPLHQDEVMPSSSALKTPFLNSPCLRNHIEVTSNSYYKNRNDSVSVVPLDSTALPLATKLGRISSQQLECMKIQAAGPSSEHTHLSEMGSDDSRLGDFHPHKSDDTSLSDMDSDDDRKIILKLLKLPVAREVHQSKE
jgi:hypothetical protein